MARFTTKMFFKVSLAISAFLLICKVESRQELDWGVYEMVDFRQDLNAVSNQTDALLARYPDLITIARAVLKSTASNGSLNMTEVCKLIETQVKGLKDSCNFSQFIAQGTLHLPEHCDDNRYNSSSIDSKFAFLCGVPPFPVNYSSLANNYTPFPVNDSSLANNFASFPGNYTPFPGNYTPFPIGYSPPPEIHLTLPPVNFSSVPVSLFPLSFNFTVPIGYDGEMPSNILFMAIKILAGTAVAANKRRCKELRGTFDDGTLSCFNNGTLVSVKPKVDKALQTISIVGNVTSLVFLIILVATYIKFEKHKTLAGKNIICLAGSLAFVHSIQVILVYFADTVWVCRAGAVLLHYTLILTFSWMAVIAMDFYITFSKVRPVDQTERKQRFKIYLRLTFGFSTCLLIICLAIDISSKRHSGYGLNSVCFISQFWANLFAFVIIVAVILLANVVLLTLTIAKLHSIMKSTSKAITSSSSASSRNPKISKKRELVLSSMTLKLSIILGLGWIFAFIESSYNSKTLQYIYNIIIAFQGFLVFLAFGCHDKCWNILKTRLFAMIPSLKDLEAQTASTSMEMNLV